MTNRDRIFDPPTLTDEQMQEKLVELLAPKGYIEAFIIATIVEHLSSYGLKRLVQMIERRKEWADVAHDDN
jgi:hypothetical protein